MKLSQLIGRLTTPAIALSLAACGGGGSGPNQAPAPQPAPAPTSIAVVGTITGFGSIWVSDDRYEIRSDTIIDIEGEPATMGDDSRLRLGMKVRIFGEDDGGNRTADRIEYDDDLRGVVETVGPDANDPTIGIFTLIDHVVTVDGNTIFDNDVGDNDGVPGIDLRDLRVGMVVEVSGFPIDGGYLATRVDREFDAAGGDPIVGDPDVDDDELEIKGIVESIASDGRSLRLRDNAHDFVIDGNTLFEDGLMLNDDLLGAFVELKIDIIGVDMVIRRIENEEELGDEDENSQVEIEGVLTDADPDSTPNTFTILGRTIPVTSASSLVPLIGMRVEIKGSFNADGVFVLREAEQDVEENVRTEDLISEVNPAVPSFTTRLGLTIAPNGGSRVQDDAADDDGGDHLTPQEFVDRLQIGDRMEARAFENDDDTLSWTRVERDETAAENGDFECELRGPVTRKDGDAASFSFVIRGITVLTDSVAEDNFEGEDGMPIGRLAFFDNLDVGDIVEAESFDGDVFCVPGTLDAREVEFQQDVPLP